MKKALFLMLSMVLSLFVLIGCGGADTSNKDDNSDKKDNDDKGGKNISLVLKYDDEENKRKQTKIEFTDDKNCVVRFNIDGNTEKKKCSYTVYETSDERWLIEVNATTLAHKLKDENMCSTFYLGEQDDGSWKYYGSSIGDSLYGVTYVYEFYDEPDFKIKKELPYVDIVLSEYEQKDEDGGIKIYIPEKVDRKIVEVSYTCINESGFEYTEKTSSEIDAVYGNFVFLKEPFDVPRMMKKSRFESELVDNMPECRQKSIFLSFYHCKSLTDPILSTAAKRELFEKYPILEKFDIYEFDCTAAKLNELKNLAYYIMETSPMYDYEEMLKDYLTVEYKQVCGVMEYSDDGEIKMNYFNNNSENYVPKEREYKAK